MTDFESIISEIKSNGNLRSIPNECDTTRIIDFSSNDYLGIADNTELKEEFLSNFKDTDFLPSSSSARLLSAHQNDFVNVESLLSEYFGKDILLYNSGYHVNTGVISAICDKGTLIIADKLVHASIIDGIVLSRAPFLRFRHNDYKHLYNILKENYSKYEQCVVVTESIFSMDGDIADLNTICALKDEFPNVLIYVDEAHAFGVRGNIGLGIAEERGLLNKIDIIVGTFGKAIASVGAFVACRSTIKQFLINKSRSFIFSTALPPVNMKWTEFVLSKLPEMNNIRASISEMSKTLSTVINEYHTTESQSQIIPLIIGDSEKTINISTKIKALGYRALPVRPPTVPIGSSRIRFSISGSMNTNTIAKLCSDLKVILH